MTDEEKLKQQMTFFDYIYPSLSQRIDSLEKAVNNLNHKNLETILQRKHLIEHVDQYKRKIQKIERFLIENGLIKLLNQKEK